MSQPTLGDRIISILVGTLGSLIPSGVSSAVDNAIDFAYVRVLGLPFIVLGYRQSGKTTLLEWLRRDTSYLADFDPDPTAAGGDPVAGDPVAGGQSSAGELCSRPPRKCVRSSWNSECISRERSRSC